MTSLQKDSASEIPEWLRLYFDAPRDADSRKVLQNVQLDQFSLKVGNVWCVELLWLKEKIKKNRNKLDMQQESGWRALAVDQ